MAKNPQIITYKNENVKSICFALVLRIGAINDPINKSGMTHLIEHLVFRKAENLNQSQIYDKLERLGVFIYAATNKDYIRFDFKCRKDVFAETIQLFSKMLDEVDYSEEDLRLERGVVLAEIYQDSYDHSEYLESFFWNDKRYSNKILGEKETLLYITLSDVVNYKKYLLDNNNGTIFIMGNYSESDLNLTEKLFSRIINNKPGIKNDSKFVQNTVEKINFIKDKWGNEIHYVYHLNIKGEERTKKIILTQILNYIFFKGNCSYIKETLREKEGFVYTIDSLVNIAKEELIFSFNFEIDNANVLPSIIGLENRLSDFKVSQKHLEYIKANFCDYAELYYDNMYELLNEYVYNYLDFNAIVSPEEYNRIILSLKKDDYMDFFKELSKEKKVFIYGKVDRFQKKKIKKLFK